MCFPVLWDVARAAFSLKLPLVFPSGNVPAGWKAQREKPQSLVVKK